MFDPVDRHKHTCSNGAIPAVDKNRLVVRVIDNLQESLDHFRTREVAVRQMDKLNAVSVREFPFGLTLWLLDLLIGKEAHNGFYPIALLQLLESGYRRNPTAK
jgi:hypothetical protein